MKVGSGVKPLHEDDLVLFYLELMLAWYVLLWGAIVCCFLMYNRPTIYVKLSHTFNNMVLIMLMCVNLKMEFEYTSESYMQMFYIPYWAQIFMVVVTFMISMVTILFPKKLETEIRMVQRYKFYTLMAKLTFIVIYYNFFLRIWLLTLISCGFDWDYIDTPSIDWIVMSLWPYAVLATLGSWMTLYYLDWPTVKRFVERLRQFYRLTHRLSRLFKRTLKRRGSRADASKTEPKSKPEPKDKEVEMAQAR